MSDGRFWAGGKLVLAYTKKQGKAPKCGDCGSTLAGVSIYIGAGLGNGNGDFGRSSGPLSWTRRPSRTQADYTVSRSLSSGRGNSPRFRSG